MLGCLVFNIVVREGLIEVTLGEDLRRRGSRLRAHMGGVAARRLSSLRQLHIWWVWELQRAGLSGVW